MNRGILTTLYFTTKTDLRVPENFHAFEKTIAAAFERAYGDEPFVRLLGHKALPDTKNVVGSNFIEIAWRLDPRTGRLIVMSALDNILKGASAQAVQCFNISCGYPESEGLYL